MFQRYPHPLFHNKLLVLSSTKLSFHQIQRLEESEKHPFCIFCFSYKKIYQEYPQEYVGTYHHYTVHHRNSTNPFPKKFPFSRKMRTGKFKKNHPVTNRIQRFPIGIKFIRHREPPQITVFFGRCSRCSKSIVRENRGLRSV